MKRTTCIFLVFACSVIIGLYGCKKDGTVPSLSATNLRDRFYSNNSLFVNGSCKINNDGGEKITSKGVCWSTSAKPTISDSCYISTDSQTDYIDFITGPLYDATNYYIRAFATNKSGTGYGTVVFFENENNHGGIYYFAPNIPIQLSPQNYATGVSIDTTLKWLYSWGNMFETDVVPANPIIYTVWMDTNSIPVTAIETDTVGTRRNIIEHDNLGNLTVYLSSNRLNLKLQTTYYWKISIRDAIGALRTSKTWSFTTASQ
jgi:hypothetical protein